VGSTDGWNANFGAGWGSFGGMPLEFSAPGAVGVGGHVLVIWR